jgi:hypothetical protein
VTNAPGQRTGILIVRAWSEGPSWNLRARIIRTVDVESDYQTVGSASSADEICRIVHEWVEVLQTNRDEGSAEPGDGPVMGQ